MKYTTTIEIKLPRQRVVELFDNPEHMQKWQPTLLRFEHVSGEQGQPGAKSRLNYKIGNRETTMTETILERNLSKSFHGTYETTGVYNVMENYFEALDENTTRWKTVSDFRFSGGYKLMGWLMPGVFKKQLR